MSAMAERHLGERRLELEGSIFYVMEVRGEDVPTWIIWKNSAVYSLVQRLAHGFRYAGSIGAGAESVDEKLAERVFFQAA